MKLTDLIEMMEEILENSTKLPLSSKVMIDKEALLEVVEEIRAKLPEEIKKAEWVNDKKDSIIQEARDEADSIIRSAEAKYKDMISESEIVRGANAQAQEITNNAKEYAKELRLGARDYVESIMKDTENRLNEALRILKNDMKDF
jgi:cell division septum initiation protein DivIVA